MGTGAGDGFFWGVGGEFSLCPFSPILRLFLVFFYPCRLSTSNQLEGRRDGGLNVGPSLSPGLHCRLRGWEMGGACVRVGTCLSNFLLPASDCSPPFLYP